MVDFLLKNIIILAQTFYIYEDEKSQLNLFGELLRSQGLIKYLVNKDWKTFARLYNGSGYSQNQYDSKLQKAYNKYKN